MTDIFKIKNYFAIITRNILLDKIEEFKKAYKNRDFKKCFKSVKELYQFVKENKVLRKDLIEDFEKEMKVFMKNSKNSNLEDICLLVMMGDLVSMVCSTMMIKYKEMSNEFWEITLEWINFRKKHA